MGLGGRGLTARRCGCADMPRQGCPPFCVDHVGYGSIIDRSYQSGLAVHVGFTPIVLQNYFGPQSGKHFSKSGPE
jgi:hypothetical protein